MATIQRTTSEPMPKHSDIRVRRINGDWALVVGFQIGEERHQVVRKLGEHPDLVDVVKKLVSEAIEEKVKELGYTVS